MQEEEASGRLGAAASEPQAEVEEPPWELVAGALVHEEAVAVLLLKVGEVEAADLPCWEAGEVEAADLPC